jgi:Protein of unknown function (DUF1348)
MRRKGFVCATVHSAGIQKRQPQGGLYSIRIGKGLVPSAAPSNTAIGMEKKRTIYVKNQNSPKGEAAAAAVSAAAQRPPLPPFTHETAVQKVRLAEDAWNSCDAEKVALAYTIDSRWRNSPNS